MLPIIYHPAYVAKGLPAHHRFPMDKFHAVAAHLVEAGLVADWDGFIQPEPAPARWLELAHDPAYVDAVLKADVDPRLARRIGFPMLESVALRSRCAVAGTVLTARLALETGAAANTAGGSHHADYEGGAGFCVFNDVAVAARLLLNEGSVSQIMVIDLDVHQGDGTARIFASEPKVFTLSVHCEQNWPRQKARSDLDIPIEKGSGDQVYLDTAMAAIRQALDHVRPDLVFYNAGVDPHHADRLGLLNLSDKGLRLRDQYVAEEVRRRGIPIVGVLGGGYSKDIQALARRHGYLHHALSEGLVPA